MRFRKRSKDITSRNKLLQQLDKKKELNKKLDINENKTTKCLFELEKLKEKNNNLQVLLLKEGGNASIEFLYEKEAKLNLYRSNDMAYKRELKVFLEFAPFAIARKLFEKTKRQIEKDFKSAESSITSSNINSTLDSIINELDKKVTAIISSKDEGVRLQKVLENLITAHKKTRDRDDYLMSIGREEYDEFTAVFFNLNSTYKIEFEHLVDDYKKNKQNLDRVSREIRRIYNKESDTVIAELRNKKNIYEKKIKNTEEDLRLLHEEKGSITNELAIVKKQISGLSKKVSLDGLDHKKDLLAQELISELETFLTYFKEEKKTSFEEKIKSTLNSLMHKCNFISKVEVEVNNDLIDIHLISKDESVIKKESLSKGEQQLFATSILKALVDESGIMFPVLIDSPLQKLDKRHADKIIREFYPSISEQVILFPLLNKELTEEEYELMRPYVNASYLIDNNNSNSFIKEVDIDVLMNC